MCGVWVCSRLVTREGVRGVIPHIDATRHMPVPHPMESDRVWAY